MKFISVAQEYYSATQLLSYSDKVKMMSMSMVEGDAKSKSAKLGSLIQ